MEIKMSGYVYILEDDNQKYYIGSSTKPLERYKRHLSGFVFTTHRMKNPKLIFVQEFETIQLAAKIEKRLKKLKRKDYIEKIIEDGYIKMR
jgi:predicted GIY-YIG superfamily endonuclease